MRWIERFDPIGRLVVPVRMAGVVHGHAKDLPRRRQELVVEGSLTQPVPSIASCLAGSTRTAKMASAGALMVALTQTVSLATATTSCLMDWKPNTGQTQPRASRLMCDVPTGRLRTEVSGARR
jgi:hypothetical protein